MENGLGDIRAKMSSKRDMRLFPTDMSFEELQNEYRRIIDFKDDCHISFAPNATTIITELFKRYVDDDTLVITTKSEHPSVVENLEKCKNVLRISKDSVLNNHINLKRHIDGFDKIFVYTIGLSMGNDYRTPDFLHPYIRSISTGKKVTCVLDAVQEMFLLPRDYSPYDYVIGTAHAIIPNFNMGIVISKDVFDEDVQNGYDFLRLLQPMMEKRDVIYLFNYVMNEHFSRYTMTDENLYHTSNCPYIFTLNDRLGRIDGIQEIIGERPTDSIVTFRACNDFVNMDKFMNKLKLVENRLLNQ